MRYPDQRARQTTVIGKYMMIGSLLVSLLIGACSSNQVDDAYKESNKRKAAESNTSLGLEYMERGQYEVALGKLKKAVAEDPGYAPGHTVLAVLYERIGEFELAGKHYQEAYEADPENGDVNNNYGTYLCKTGKSKQAIGHLTRALDDPFYNSPEVALTNAGSCEMGAGNLPEADEFLRQALKSNPSFPDALLAMAELNYREKSYLTSRAFVQRYETVSRHNASSLLLAFKVETALGDEKASKKYMLALETNFSDSEQAAEARKISGR